MKPLILTLQAFGTFKDTVVIDFRQFDTAGLFLITGPTGSGKTTIFDGLMYALYGVMSGDDRDSTKTVKSQFASDEVECYVELQFVAQEREYTIRRSPEQRTLGKSKRVIDQKPLVFLTTPDEKLTKITEVNNKIQEILNLTATQFKQIVLLPQGEFKKLLFASSLEKESILRSVFNTQEIQRFSDLLKKKSIDVSKEVSSIRTKILVLFQSIENPSEAIEQAITLEDLDEVIRLLKQSIEQYQRQLSENRQQESMIKKQVSSLESEIYLKNEQKTLLENQVQLLSHSEEMKSLQKTIHDALLFEKAFELLKNVNELQAQKEQLNNEILTVQFAVEKSKKQIDFLNHQFEASQVEYNKLPLVKKELSELQQLINKQVELQKLQTRQKNNARAIVETSEKIESLNLNLLEAKKKQQLFQEVSVKITHLTLLKNEDLLLIEKLKSKQQQINQQLAFTKEIDEINQELIKLHETLKTSIQQKVELELKIQELEANRKHNLAATLASGLQENHPCPVCGSLHHPQVASTTRMVGDSDLLNQQLQVVQRVIIESETKQISLSLQKEKLLKNVVDENLDNLLKTNQKQVREINEKVSKTDAEILDLKKLVVGNSQKDVDELSQEIHQLMGVLKSKKNDQEQTKSDIEKIEIDTNDSDFDVLVEQELKLKEHLDTVEKEFVLLSQKLNENTQEYTRLVATQKGYQRQLEKVKESHLQKLRGYESYLVENNIVDNYQELMIDKTLIEEYQQKVSAYEQQVFSLTEALTKNLNALSKLSLNDNPESLLIEKNSELQTIHQQYAEMMHAYLNHDKLCDSLVEVHQNQQELLDKFKMMSLLSDIANGSAYSGNVSFERFVLSMYFDEVLKLANLRLLEMTQSRYELVRQEENRNNRGAKGLELDVMDFYSSQMRSVKTLSGGETFKASLSLALGLSDFIKTIKGGTSIDALFVDEGFGSLDASSLDSAIEVLLKLNESGRLVGIISHVSELKQRITAQIVLEKTIDGSHVTVLV